MTFGVAQLQRKVLENMKHLLTKIEDRWRISILYKSATARGIFEWAECDYVNEKFTCNQECQIHSETQLNYSAKYRECSWIYDHSLKGWALGKWKRSCI